MLTGVARSVKSAGFTLIELMIVVAVLGALVMVGMPSFRQMMKNYEVRVAAESISNGVQRARAEAVSRNASVEFVLGTGTAWNVNVVGGANIESRSSAEGSANAALQALDGSLNVLTIPATVTFNSLGQMVANADASAPIRRVNLNATAAGGNQTLRVTIGAGGSARVCDTSLPASNVRSCPATD